MLFQILKTLVLEVPISSEVLLLMQEICISVHPQTATYFVSLFYFEYRFNLGFTNELHVFRLLANLLNIFIFAFAPNTFPYIGYSSLKKN